MEQTLGLHSLFLVPRASAPERFIPASPLDWWRDPGQHRAGLCQLIQQSEGFRKAHEAGAAPAAGSTFASSLSSDCSLVASGAARAARAGGSTFALVAQ